MRSSATPPNTIAPSRPLPTGSASTHPLVCALGLSEYFQFGSSGAGWAYQSFSSAAEANDAAHRMIATTTRVLMTNLLLVQRASGSQTDISDAPRLSHAKYGTRTR